MRKLDEATKKRRKKKASAMVWASVYLLVTMCICASASVIFVRSYYKPIFISGGSMYPTLLGGQYVPGVNNFGYCDSHKSMIDSIERFDIITSYFPWAAEGDYQGGYHRVDDKNPEPNVLLDTASYKIKRVIGMPGDTFKIVNNELFIKDKETNEYPVKWDEALGQNVEIPTKLPFKPFLQNGIKTVNVAERTLKDDEYWVMGDNWQGSKDCVDYNSPIYYENIVGVLIVILGTCRVIQTNNNKIEQIDDRVYKWPVFYK